MDHDAQIGHWAGNSGMISMRRIIATALLALAAGSALAADMAPPPAVLRGALPASDGIDWSGFYVGGSASYNAMSLNRNRGQGSIDGLLSRLVRGTIVEQGVRAMPLVDQGSFNTNKVGFGGFVGYNWMTEGAVYGVEADYTRATIKNEINSARSGRITSTTLPATTYEWNANTYKRSKITEFGTIRGRLGYAYGAFLPFMTAGVAIARSAEVRSASISGVQWDPTLGGSCAAAAPSCGVTNYNPSSISEGNRAKLQMGYALGLGFDYAFSSNIFVRAELQHVRFPNIANTSAQLNQGRVGAAVKF
jgi:outer membrane immunogenic protein